MLRELTWVYDQVTTTGGPAHWLESEPPNRKAGQEAESGQLETGMELCRSTQDQDQGKRKLWNSILVAAAEDKR